VSGALAAEPQPDPPAVVTDPRPTGRAQRGPKSDRHLEFVPVYGRPLRIARAEQRPTEPFADRRDVGRTADQQDVGQRDALRLRFAQRGMTARHRPVDQVPCSAATRAA
jgi:hypothetical protein